VHDAVALGDAMKLLDEGGLRCLLAADAPDSLAHVAARATSTNLVLLIGPEGGLADAEQKYAQANGFISCRLGPRIMRTETAGLAALAALQAVAGDFRL
jgi:16S rRNA (uracil1498-N3)-methyltransferase